MALIRAHLLASQGEPYRPRHASDETAAWYSADYIGRHRA